MEIGDSPTFETALMPADPQFGEGCQYCWPLERGDADSMLWQGQFYYNVEEFLEECPFYSPELLDNKEWLEELELEKRKTLREAGALNWEYQFFACSPLYATLINEWLAPSVAYKRHNRDWRAMDQIPPPGKEIHWGIWRNLFIFLLCLDTGPMLSALLERNNLVEPYWKDMRQGFLDILLSWDGYCEYWGEKKFYKLIGKGEIGREGLTRALQLLRIDQSTTVSCIDQSFTEKRFAPLCELLKGATPSAPGFGGPGAEGVGLGLDNDEDNPQSSPFQRGVYSIRNYVKDLVLSKQTEEELFNSVLSGLSDFEPMNGLISFNEEAGKMSRLAPFDLFADLVGNRKSSLLPLLDSIEDEDWIDREFDSLQEFLQFVKRTVKVQPETRKAILRHYTEKVTKISVNDAKVTELTTAFLLIAVLAIAPLFRPISPRSFLFRSNLNPPAFAMISSNLPSGIGLRDQNLPRRGPGLSPSKAPLQVALLAKRGDDVAVASPFSIPPAEPQEQDLVVAPSSALLYTDDLRTPSGLKIPSSSAVVRPVWEITTTTRGLRRVTDVSRTTTAGSVGDKYEVSTAHAKVVKECKAQGNRF